MVCLSGRKTQCALCSSSLGGGPPFDSGPADVRGHAPQVLMQGTWEGAVCPPVVPGPQGGMATFQHNRPRTRPQEGSGPTPRPGANPDKRQGGAPLRGPQEGHSGGELNLSPACTVAPLCPPEVRRWLRWCWFLLERIGFCRNQSGVLGQALTC